MTEYSNENRGVLFKNDRKESEQHADYRGSINVAGVDYWLDAWVKTKKDGSGKFMSLSVKPKQAAKPASSYAEQSQSSTRKSMAQQAPAGGMADMTDDPPF